jgi:hypothetical protein
MFLKFLIIFSFSTYVFSASELTPEQFAFSEKIAGIFQLGNVSEYKNLIHSKCPIDEAKLSDVTKNLWTKRYQVRLKKVTESFDLSRIKFKVIPEYDLEFQVWTKITDPMQLKMLKGVTEIELTKVFPVAKEESLLKIIEWPCFDSI